MSPLFHGAIETKKILRPFPNGEALFSIGTIKVDEKRLASGDQEVLELEVSVEEPGLVELTEEKACRSNRFSF